MDAASPPRPSIITFVLKPQVAPHVNVRDLVVARRPSTAPAAGEARGKQKRGKRGVSGHDVSGVAGNKGLEAFLSLDHSVQVGGRRGKAVEETVGLACPFRVNAQQTRG